MGITSAGRNLHLQPGTCCGLFARAEGQASREHRRAPLFSDTLEVNHPDRTQQHFRTSSTFAEPHDANQDIIEIYCAKQQFKDVAAPEVGLPALPSSAPAPTACHPSYMIKRPPVTQSNSTYTITQSTSILHSCTCLPHHARRSQHPLTSRGGHLAAGQGAASE